MHWIKSGICFLSPHTLILSPPVQTPEKIKSPYGIGAVTPIPLKCFTKSWSFAAVVKNIIKLFFWFFFWFFSLAVSLYPTSLSSLGIESICHPNRVEEVLDLMAQLTRTPTGRSMSVLDDPVVYAISQIYYPCTILVKS